MQQASWCVLFLCCERMEVMKLRKNINRLWSLNFKMLHFYLWVWNLNFCNTRLRNPRVVNYKSRAHSPPLTTYSHIQSDEEKLKFVFLVSSTRKLYHRLHLRLPICIRGCFRKAASSHRLFIVLTYLLTQSIFVCDCWFRSPFVPLFHR